MLMRVDESSALSLARAFSGYINELVHSGSTFEFGGVSGPTPVSMIFKEALKFVYWQHCSFKALETKNIFNTFCFHDMLSPYYWQHCSFKELETKKFLNFFCFHYMLSPYFLRNHKICKIATLLHSHT